MWKVDNLNASRVSQSLDVDVSARARPALLDDRPERTTVKSKDE